jgi:hypothetical protein
MMLKLVRHPIAEAAAVSALEARADRDGARLSLSYVLAADLARLAIPARVAAARADELWRHTCFEAFVRAAASDAYLELNFAPSTAWAAYRFAGYRDGMRNAEIAPPEIDFATAADRLTLTASVDLSTLPDLAAAARWRIALTAVIEDAAGALSYWSLAHAPGRPDFHHSAGFEAEL